MANGNVPFLTALNGTLTDDPALDGAMPENLRDAADVYSKAEITGAPVAGSALETLIGVDEDGNLASQKAPSEIVLRPSQTGNDYAQIQAALNVGGTIRFTGGRFTKPRSSPALKIVADTRLIWDDDAELYFYDIQVGQGSPCIGAYDPDTGATVDVDVELVNPRFIGTWGDVGVGYGLGSHFLELRITGEFKMTGGYFTKSRYTTITVQSAKSVIIRGTRIELSKRGGLHIIQGRSAVITGCVLDQVMDDSISVHLEDSQTQLDHDVVVSGNIVRDGQGIVLCGAKRFAITSNQLHRCATRAIYIGENGGTEGNTPTVLGIIANNVIDTVINGFQVAAASIPNGGLGDGTLGGGNQCNYIKVAGPVPVAVTGGGFAEQGDGAGGVVNPISYLEVNNTDGANPTVVGDPPVNVGSRNIIISNNVFMRTMEQGQLYSFYGYGSRMTQGGPCDVVLTASMLGLLTNNGMLNIENHLANAVIEGNNFWGAQDCIVFSGTTSSSYVSWKDVLLANNEYEHYRANGVNIIGRGTVEIKGELFDGDPYCVNTNRAAASPNHGKWQTGNSHCAVKFGSSDAYAVVTGCSFKNLQKIDGGVGYPNASWSNNTMYCNPVAAGFSANNIGIGTISQASRYGITNLVIQDGDPSNSTFLDILGICLKESSAKPTTGTYVEGWFVKNTDPTVSSNFRLDGWHRVTTGSGHTIGTDWVEIWSTTDFAANTFTPTVTAAAGTITTLGTVTGVYRRFMGLVWVEYVINITTNGTAATALQMTLPFTAATGANSVLNGREHTVAGQQLQGLITSGATNVSVRTDDNTYPGADGATIYLSGWYRAA